ncbi:MAG: bifunctional demethylmenaquinone methyltransferase/2-methoxy-6-polyprenyl-1,4-benzoquinol methylase UbiE [Deltaproteobacteria bacterium]|nr:MAG: bifunctional demethylmenaquinone methyltransferase/2-methoxy-6-polyprenyl-1,4-benzoquinol methylase UbiE [Deltaproteobacteria bacterium]
MSRGASGLPSPRPGSGEMFDAIAHRYDLVNRILSFGVDLRWRKETVRALALRAGDRVLDLATGTGDLAIAIARRHPDVTVVGVDPSRRMLEVAEQKVRRRALAGRIALRLGDAQALPFGDDYFDATTIAFGIRNVPDRRRALEEMRRVTRPGGRITILELNEPEGRWMGPLARLYIHRLVPWIGSAFSGNGEYRYLQRSIAAFPSPADFALVMRSAGLTQVEPRPLTFGVCTLFIARVPEEER